jgi:hypothetical protein
MIIWFATGKISSVWAAPPRALFYMSRIEPGSSRNNGVKTPKRRRKTFAKVRPSPEGKERKDGEIPRRFG